ncbi:uveal autoantigen with coiled-coil domains and ankyrin repeats-like [Octopus sinensis]|uniref:Uveal autoantigen with coiled-coil domains and ankyrin repeats-like n=1 Tax=Octopus sinensis TaxID=2607531 RepID=A0A7E6EZ66_9MOLL|nr:uveal autoantigen with coiled-coil domains and ankyrin repeats-like [Octopus sinensis]
MMATASEAICEISDINSELPITDVVAVKDTVQIPVKKEYVINTLDHLRAIDNVIKEGTNDENAVEKIPLITNCIQTLDNQRFHFHEELEKETIIRFALQHCLMNLPTNIQNEINAAVEAAKRQNDAIRKSKIEGLNDLEEKISKAREEQVRFEKENNILLPQRNEMRKSHDRCLLDLNKLLAHKSELQISLNETREKISLHNQEIVQTEYDILELRNAVAKEWEDANKKIEEYKIDIENTEKCLKMELSRNEVTKKEEVKIKEELSASNLLNQDIQTNERSLNNEVVSKKKEYQMLQLELDAELKLEQNLLSEKKKLSQQQLKLTNKSDTLTSEKKKILNELNMRYQYETDNSVHLKQQLKDQQEALRVNKEALIKSEEKLEIIKNEHKIKEAEYKTQKEALRNLEKTNREISETIQRAKISNSLTVAHLNQQIEKYGQKYEEEKQLREDIQQEKKDIYTEIDITKAHQREYAGEMKKKIADMKEQCTEKDEQAESLKNVIQELDNKICSLEKEIESDKTKFAALIDQKKEKIKETQQAISKLEETVKEKNAVIEKRTPAFEEMEKHFQQQTDIFNESKDTFIVTRRTDIALTNEIKEMENSVAEAEAPLNDLRNKIKESREEYLRLLDSHSQESKTTEEEIYAQSCKLKILIEENNRLKQDTLAKERESEDVIKSTEKLEKILLQLKREVLNAKEEFSKDLTTMSDMQEKIQKRDQLTVDQMDVSKNIIDTNIQIVNNVSKKVHKQLETLGTYLKGTEIRRPD